MRYYLDCEFDGHNGPLLSIALVHEAGGGSIHIQTDAYPKDRWVQQNVMPVMDEHYARYAYSDVDPNHVGSLLRNWLGVASMFEIVADSPVDIARFCQAISTNDQGGWENTPYTEMTFKVYNVECYPNDLDGAIQHNAWWDARSLRYKIENDGIL